MAVADTARLIASLELKDLFSKQIGNAEKSLGKFDKKLDQTQSRAYRAGQQIGHGIQNSARIIATAAVTIGTISAGVLAKGIAAASDLNETVSKVGVVFKQQAAGVLAFGKTSAAALGLSQQAALEAAATYGNLFVSMGLVPKQAAKMSTAMVKLAADLASFNNVSPEDALLALRSGLVGETEPLRRFGINLNEQTLKAKALELGLVKLQKGQKQYTAVLTPAQKAQAAYALILEQSKTAQGDFARTSGGLANQVRILKANFTDMLATIGSPVLPQVAKVFQRINALVKENQPQVAKLGQAVADLFTDENLNKGVELLKGAVGTFKAAAPFLEASAKATLGFVQAAVSVFKSLPAPLQGLLAGGFALNKLTGGLVTNIAGGVLDLIGKSRGATPANPVFVSDISGGLGGAAAAGGGLLGKLGGLITKLGGLALVLGGLQGLSAGVQQGGPAGAGIGALGAGATIAGGALLAGPLGAIVASLGVMGKTLLDIRDTSKGQGDSIAASIQSQISGGAKLSDLKTSLAAVNTGINDIQANPLNVLLAGDALDQLKAQKALLEKQILESTRGTTAIVNAATGFTTGLSKFTPGKEKDDIVNLIQLQKSAQAFLRDQFREMLAGIRKASSPAQIAAVIKSIEKNVFERGKGGTGGAKDVIAALKGLLLKTDDPKSRAAIQGEIRRMEKQLNYRTLVAAQLKKADQIFHSNESTKRKIDELKGVQRQLSSKDLAAQHAVQAKIDALKRAEVYAQHATTQAVKDKDLSVKVTVPVTNRVVVNSRTITNQTKVISRLFAVPS